MLGALVVFLARLSSSSLSVGGLQLVNSEFIGIRAVGGVPSRSLVDGNVPIVFRGCRVGDVQVSGGFLRGFGSDVVVEGSVFRDIQGGSVVTADNCPTERYTTDQQLTGDLTFRAIQGGGTLTIKNAKFKGVTSCAYEGVGSLNGGAVLAQSGATGLVLDTVEFIRCQTAETGSTGVGEGGAVACWTNVFQMSSCVFKDCTSQISIVLYEGSATEQTITGCKFENTDITGSGDKVKCGGSGLQLTNVLDVILVDCHFTGTKRSQDGAGGAYGVHTHNNGVTLTLTDCTFTRTLSPRGGSIGVSKRCSKIVVTNCRFSETQATNGNGGVFFFGNAESKPSVFTIEDSVFEEVSATNGGFTFINADSGLLTVQDFTMRNTTLDGFTVTASDAYVLNIKVTGEFVFDNNTVSNMECLDAIRFTVQNSSLEFNDCSFENLQSSRFVLAITPNSGVTIDSLVLRRCALSGTTQTSEQYVFNHFGSFLATSELEDCYFENTNIANNFLVTQQSLTLRDCHFASVIGPSRANLLSGNVSEISDCSFVEIAMTVAGKYFTDFTKLTMSNVTIVKCGKAINMRAGASAPDVVLNKLNVSQTSFVLDVDTLEVRDSVFFDLVPIDDSAFKQCLYIFADSTLIFDSCQFHGVTSGDGPLFRFNGVLGSTLTFKNCCFQGAPVGNDAHYINVVRYSGTVIFQHPTCIDKDESSAIQYSASRPVDTEGVEFNCELCTVDPVTETSEELDPQDPSETSEELDPSEEVDSPLETSEDVEPEPPASSEEKPETAEPEPDTSSSGEGSNSNGLPPGAAAGIAIAVIAVVAAVVAVIVILLLRKKRRGSDDDDDDEMFDEDSITDQEAVTVTMQDPIPEESHVTNPLFTVPADGDDFSSVFEETK